MVLRSNEGGAAQGVSGAVFDSNEITERKLGDGYALFRDDQYGIAFEYPQDMKIERFPEEKGETIVFNGSVAEPSFQIYIVSTENDPSTNPKLTKERILEDVPGLIIEDPQHVLLANLVYGLLFYSQDETIGRTREMWFAVNGYLFQVTAKATHDDFLAKIFSSLRIRSLGV